MIEHPVALLEMIDLPSREKAAPLRREMERSREDVKAYDVAAGHDERLARRKAVLVQERADRIYAFLANKRHGAQRDLIHA